LKRLAAASGQDLSSYVLSRAIPSAQQKFAELLAELGDTGQPRFVLAALNDLLAALAADELREAVAHADLERLRPLLSNYVAALVEQACYRRSVRPPAWTTAISPLDAPHFAAPLKSLRLHLLRESPVPFKRRNIFVDTAIGGRV
jgi:hypothetical protein